MNLTNQFIDNLVSHLSEVKQSQITFNDLKTELLRKNDKDVQVYNLGVKEDDNVALIFNNNYLQEFEQTHLNFNNKS